MTTQKPETAKKRRGRNPKIVINADELEHIEALADGAMQRNPALADRLLGEIGRARVVVPAKMPADVVSIGSRVTYRDETTGQDKTVTLVYPEDADISQQQVSIMTPIGVALLGLSTGAEFYWDTRDNQRRILTVIGVEQCDTANSDAEG
ncbi:nucleoside diphosphate kinase regulator [Rhodobacteraceae bacterium F11138]|nr:nucleoside diphosphate kinase regulator [Rhodobacteraceae bacterium F11138]